MPQIIAAMDEDSKISRLMGCCIVGVFLKVCGRQFDEDQFTKIYPGKCESFWVLWWRHVSILEKLPLLFLLKCHRSFVCNDKKSSFWSGKQILSVALGFTPKVVHLTCSLIAAGSNESTNTD